MGKLNFLHYFEPNSILFSLGPMVVYWYGFFVVLGLLLGIIITLKLAKLHKIEEEKILDMSFWLIIFSLLGARIYHVLLELPYYLSNPIQIPMIWNGGIAIHGALIAGVITIYYYSKKIGISFLKVTAIIAPGLALGQAVGRWGNYFNQELFGKPTDLPWGIPISSPHIPAEYLGNTYFHPTFFYESIGSLLIFLFLIFLNYLIIKKNKLRLEFIPFLYLMLYSILRFATEVIRIDKTPELLGLRLPQIVSLIIIILSILGLYLYNKRFHQTEE